MKVDLSKGREGKEKGEEEREDGGIVGGNVREEERQ